MSADLAAIRARLAAGGPRLVALVQGGRRWGLNAMHSLIAHAPADLAALCDEVESLRAAVERVRLVAGGWRARGAHQMNYADSAPEEVRDALRDTAADWITKAEHILRALDGAE